MNVDYLVLADAAAASEGKHYIHGAGWDTIFAANFPVQHPAMSAAVRIRIPWTATNHPHQLELNVLDADGRSALPDPPGALKGDINVGRPAHLSTGDDQVVCLVFNLFNLQFEGAGTYSVVFIIDGSEEARQPFKVAQVPGLQLQAPHSPR